MASQTSHIDGRSTTPPRRIRRTIFSFLSSRSLRSLRRTNRRINSLVAAEGPRMFNEIRFHLDLRARTPLNHQVFISALGRIGHYARLLVITFHNVGPIEFGPLHSEDPTRKSSLNPIPAQGHFGQHGTYRLVGPDIPVMPGIFEDLNLESNEEGFFKKVFDRLPRLQALSIRCNPSVEHLWGRTLLDEALVYLRCQFEESRHIMSGFLVLTTLDLQLPTPLALWHLRSFPGYGDGGNPLLGREGAWSNVRNLSLTLPPATIAGSSERQLIMMRGIQGFISGFSLTLARLSITGGTGNPLTYDLGPNIGGMLQRTRFGHLRELRLKDVKIDWEDLEEFLTDPRRGYSVFNLGLCGVEFTRSSGWKRLYMFFELEHPERMSRPNMPLQLTRKLQLLNKPGELRQGRK
ncbi:unnamed protein product [Tuber melanosporum]|uniref:(Perigord truffle) hypothetical protein n=1 Tax=Tuber melanosporum (strain Mel28) TaxID=656061 RepID=D5GNZ2_TUBMM|nr:uncharacterized protein GSTUM_00011593001 [Tuber melanosporum]CAZ86235.1 unnamed protein product [Tuber melanosporum]